MKLAINDSFYISDIAQGDQPAYIEHFKVRQIYEQTLSIPFPYGQADADWWVEHNLAAYARAGGRSSNWAIRRAADGFLVGGIGFVDLHVGQAFKAEVGYFLAKPYWGQGLMSEAVSKVCDYGFKEFELEKITAHIFAYNTGSARVLEKNGFQCEGLLRSHYKKDGRLFDGKIYGRLANEAAASLPRPDFIKHFSEIQERDDSHYPGSDELLSIGSAFGKKFGFKNLGIHHELLPPGRRTSWPHAESVEEEFAYVIEGNPDVWVDGVLHRLRPGDAVGFVPGTGICHTFINNTDLPARLLVVGQTSQKDNRCYYAKHPERNEVARREGWLWENPPARPVGPHDGVPDAGRKK